MKKKYWIWIGAAVLAAVVAIGFLLWPKGETLVFPEVPAAGGYEMKTETMQFSVVVSDGCRYTCIQFLADGGRVECYESPTEVIILNHIGKTAGYYREEIKNPAFQNPLAEVFSSLGELDFSYDKNETLDGVEYKVFKAVRVTESLKQQQIDYDNYLIAMDWIDEAYYEFEYLVYSDGATLISAEAPSEINPLIVKDTPWIVDLEAKAVKNLRTGETVAFSIQGITQGKALSPNGSSETEQVQEEIFAYADAQTGALKKYRYNQGAVFSILYSAQITRPEITADMTELTEEELQYIMMLLSVV